MTGTICDVERRNPTPRHSYLTETRLSQTLSLSSKSLIHYPTYPALNECKDKTRIVFNDTLTNRFIRLDHMSACCDLKDKESVLDEKKQIVQRVPFAHMDYSKYVLPCVTPKRHYDLETVASGPRQLSHARFSQHNENVNKKMISKVGDIADFHTQRSPSLLCRLHFTAASPVCVRTYLGGNGGLVPPLPFCLTN